MLTAREFKIAQKMLTIERSIRVKELSEMFGVSQRTIKYDLDNIRYFFTGLGISVLSQPNKGIWLDCTDEKKERANTIMSKMQNENLYFNQEMRANKILLQLFSTNEFVTAQSLAEYLNVNRNTIFKDLEYIDTILKNSGIGLMRKPRKGFNLSGTENKIRSYFENLIYRNLRAYDIYLINDSIKQGLKKAASELGLPNIFNKHYEIVEYELHTAYKKNNELFLRENIISTVVRLLLSMTRVEIGTLVDEAEIPIKSGSTALDSIWAGIFKASALPVYKSEIEYIGAKPGKEISIDLTALTSELIKMVSDGSSIDYNKDTTLYSRLLSHLTLTLNEPENDIKENPFNKAIVENHKHTFDIVKLVCENHLKHNPVINNESFISYIVLHFLVSQRNLARLKKFKAIFVCATGRGAAKIIERMIESEVKELEVIGNCSLSEAEAVSKKLKPDYIISIFPVKSEVPVIIVEPIPTKEDLRYIQTLISERLDKDILRDDSFSKILSFDENDKDAEDTSLEVIISGLNIYNKFLQAGYPVKDGMGFAFLTHIMLFAHRYYFNNQYGENEDDIKIVSQIKTMLEDIGVHITSDEVKALLNYFLQK